MSGQLLIKEVAKFDHDFSQLPSGLYLLKLKANQKTTTQKLRIE